MQAHFWQTDIEGAVYSHLPSDDIGEYYNKTNLAAMTGALGTTVVEEPFEPLYTRLSEVALAHPEIVIYTVNGDYHAWTEVRANGVVNNSPSSHDTNHNWMIFQGEGDSRTLTMYAKLSVKEDPFWPVQATQMWSMNAYETEPYGHTYVKYHA